MTESQFQQLCCDIGELLKDASANSINNTNSLISNGYIELQGVNHRIFFDEVLTPDTIVCLSELGVIGEEKREQKLETLLGMNLFSSSSFPMAFGIDPTLEKAVCVRHFDVATSLSADELANHLHQMSVYARHLQHEIALAPVPTAYRGTPNVNHAIA